MEMTGNDHKLGLGIMVRAEKLRLLFRQSSAAILASVLSAILLTAMLWPVQDHALLLAWFFLLLMAAVTRLVLLIQYRRKSLSLRDTLAWEKPLFIGLMLSSLIWGAGGVFILPDQSAYHQAVVFCVLVGMSGGVASAYAAHRLMALLAVAFVLLPITGWMLLQGSVTSVGMGIFALVFYALLIRSTMLLTEVLRQKFTLNYQLQQAKENAERLARMDALTGLYNRHAFYEQAGLMSHHAERHNMTFAVIIMDIDHFKRINDTRGHVAGDAVLSRMGDLLGSLTRKSDVCARVGGEEFGILSLSTNFTGACALAEKLRRGVEAASIEFDAKHFSVTASFGVAGGGSSNVGALVKRADAAMYRSKSAGRNRVVTDHRQA